MAVLNNTGILMGSSAVEDDAAYQIEKSLRFENADSSYLQYSQQEGNRRAWTFSVWVKRNKTVVYDHILSNVDQNSGAGFQLSFQNNDRLRVDETNGSSYQVNFSTNRLFRDPSAWYHICINLDSNQSIETERFRIYINGKRETSFSTAGGAIVYPSQYYESKLLTTSGSSVEDKLVIGKKGDAAFGFNGYMADVYLIDGLALSPAAFGSFDSTGAWNPKAFALPGSNDGTTWSTAVSPTYTNTSGNAHFTKVFDGIENDDDGQDNNQNAWQSNTADAVATATLGVPIEYNTSLRAMLRVDSRTNGGSQTNNNCAFTTSNHGRVEHTAASLVGANTLDEDYWLTIDEGKGSLSKCEVGMAAVAGYGFSLWCLEVDGVRLEDGVTDPTERNNPNNGTEWSDYMTGSANSGAPVTRIFDGKPIGGSGNHSFANDGSHITFIPPSTITGTKIEIHTEVKGSITGTNDLKVNGTSIFNAVKTKLGENKEGWYDIGTSIDSTDGIYFGREDTNNKTFAHAIRVDGNILIDSSGDNSFHLKFNNTSDLGEDSLNSNDFTVNNIHTADTDWLVVPSSEVTGTTLRNNMFDGSLSTEVTGGDGSRVYWTPGSDITINTNGLKAYFSGGYIEYKCAIESDDGTSQIIEKTNGNANSWVTFTSFNGETIGSSNKLTFRAYRANDTDPGVLGFKAIEVNGQTVSINENNLNDVISDTPTNYGTDTGVGGEVQGNYCTLNSLVTAKTQGGTFSQGNLKFTGVSGESGYPTVMGTHGASSGKWYFEVTCTTLPANQNHGIGQAGLWDMSLAVAATGPGYGGNSYAIRTNNGNTEYNSTATAYGSAYAAGDILQVAYDLDNGKIWFGKNNTWPSSGNPATGANPAYSGLSSGEYFPALSCYDSGVFTANFGQRAFKYTAPSGFKALCTQNLPDTFSGDALNNPSKYFNAVAFNGTGNDQTIKIPSISPEFVWIKERSNAQNHQFYDVTRGTANNYKRFEMNTTAVQETKTDGVQTFNSDGFDIGGNVSLNENGETYIAWCWDAGSSAATASTEGDITPTTQWVNTEAGFSITQWTGGGGVKTIGHGLSTAPVFFMGRNLESSSATMNTFVYHHSLGATQQLFMNTTDAASGDWFNDAAPDADVWTMGDTGAGNENGGVFVGYLWREVNGFSKFGQYTGNASADGPFIYTGFQPRLVILKRDSGTGSWTVMDTTRDTYNVSDHIIDANADTAENSTHGHEIIDILSNGFKLRQASSDYRNQSGQTYVYAAWAEHPFKTARAR